MSNLKRGRTFGRNSSRRKALFKALAISLIEHEGIKTTLPKAKELRSFIEPLITLAKDDSVSNRRLAFTKIRNKSAVGKLFSDLGPRFKDRPGGYSRIIKIGFRKGDAAPIAFIELLDRTAEDETVVADAVESEKV